MKYRNYIAHERLLEVLRYEPQSGNFYWRVKASRNTIIGSVAGCLAPDGYIKIRVDNCNYQSHRLAWFYMTGMWPSEEIDHKNLIKKDNRWENLREATHQQNMLNAAKKTSIKYSYGKNKLKGAYKHPECERWFSRIRVNGKIIHLGMFDTEREAHEAYALAVPVYHGEFARAD